MSASFQNFCDALKVSPHFRFASYALCITTALASIILSFCYPDTPLPIVCMVSTPELLRSASKSIGKQNGALFGPQGEISGRKLFWGFMVCLVAFWVIGLTAAHYIARQHKPMYLIWTLVAVVWLGLLFPGFQWWRRQMHPI